MKMKTKILKRVDFCGYIFYLNNRKLFLFEITQNNLSANILDKM